MLIKRIVLVGGINIKKSTLVNFVNICVLLNYTTSFTNFYMVGLGIINKIFNVITYIVLLFSIIYLLKKIYINRASFLIYSWSILFLVCLIFVFSIIGSKFEIYSIGKCIELILTSIYAIYLVTYYKFGDIITIMLKSQVVVIFATIIFSFIFPEQSYMYYEGELVLRGAFIHKNLLAANLAFGILVSITNIETNKRYILSIINIIMSFILIIIAKSMTSLIIITLAILIKFIYRTNKNKLNPTILMMIIHFITYYIVLFGYNIQSWFEEVFNRSITLTGRTDIWLNIIDILNGNTNLDYNILIGSGFNNAWRDNSVIQWYMRSKTFSNLTGSHNGFLEWALEIGLIGISILIILLIITGYKVLKIRRLEKYQAGFLIMYIVYILTFYITERSTDPMSYQLLMLFLTICLTNKTYLKLDN